MTDRTDATLLRHLAQLKRPYGQPWDGLAAARVYDRLPLFLLPEEASELLTHESALLEAVREEGLRLPFDDFLLDFPFGVTAALRRLDPSLDRGRLWVRVRRVSAFRPDAASQLDPRHLAQVRDPEAWLLLEGWEEKTLSGGLHVTPDFSLIPVAGADLGRFEAYFHAYPNPDCLDGRRAFGLWCNVAGCARPAEPEAVRCHGSELIHAALARLVVLALVYVSEGLGGLVTEVSTPAPDPGSREAKTARLKPWLAPRRRTFILVDPARAGEYGHPSSRPASGTHASPIPHRRRGHWRHLGERRTWVRATWVGATDWTAGGRTYRVQLAPGPSKTAPGST